MSTDKTLKKRLTRPAGMVKGISKADFTLNSHKSRNGIGLGSESGSGSGSGGSDIGIKLSATTSTTRTNILTVGGTNSSKTSHSFRTAPASMPAPALSTSKNIQPDLISSEQFKTSKFTVLNDLKVKYNKKNSSKNSSKSDLNVESPEFQLLVKLFIPPKYLIRNDKISIKHLSNNLPVLTNGSMPKLNLEIHLLLSCVVNEYISSWYFSKLNTDNFDFIQHVYEMICDCVKNFSKRISLMMELPDLFILIDDLTSILNNHLRDLVIDITDDPNHVLKIIKTYRDNVQEKNIVINEKTNSEIYFDYLKESHIIFCKNQGNGSIENDQMEYFQDIDDETNVYSNDENDSIKFQSPNSKYDDDTRLIYFRILVKKLIFIIFRGDDNDNDNENDKIPIPNSSGPLTSKITMNLIIFLASDLVLEKLFNKLSSPEFFLLIVDKVTNNLVKFIEERDGKIRKNDLNKYKPSNGSFTSRMKSLISSTYADISSFLLSVSLSKKAENESYLNPSLHIFSSPLFSLFNTMTNFSNRRPIFSNFIKSTKALIFSSRTISMRIDSVLKSFISTKIVHSGALSDENLSQVVRDLKQSLFTHNDRRNNDSVASKDNLNIDILTEKVFDLFANKLSKLVPGRKSFMGNILSFEGETNDELKQSIRNFLVVFNYNPNSSDLTTLNETCQVNRLLVIQCLDCMIATLYPELVSI